MERQLENDERIRLFGNQLCSGFVDGARDDVALFCAFPLAARSSRPAKFHYKVLTKAVECNGDETDEWRCGVDGDDAVFVPVYRHCIFAIIALSILFVVLLDTAVPVMALSLESGRGSGARDADNLVGGD